MSPDDKDERMEEERKQMRDRARLDQGAALLTDVLPSVWGTLFRNCQNTGFTETQSLELVKAYIYASHATIVKGA